MKMRLFVLDENGNVVFEFNIDSDASGYHLNSSREMQAKVIKEALQFLGRRP